MEQGKAPPVNAVRTWRCDFFWRPLSWLQCGPVTRWPRDDGVNGNPQPNHLMQVTKQLALFLDNRPGTLARVCDALAGAKINIYAVATSDTVDYCVVRMVVSEPA